MEHELLNREAIQLLKKLIATPSISKEEGEVVAIITNFLASHGIDKINHVKNNIWVLNKYYDPNKKTIMLNSHHDTVKPASGYTLDPYSPIEREDKLYGLGSNDAGGALVSLIATFIHFYDKKLSYNLLLVCSAEEEISGKNGLAYALAEIPSADVAIVGEPTSLEMAISEKGLMVLDCTAKGRSGHAARNEGDNAIYKALTDIEWVKNFQFPLESHYLGPIKMTVTMIDAGTQHNVVPDQCNFTIDVRTTDVYSNQETLDIIKDNLSAAVIPRSIHLNPSKIEKDHPLVISGTALGLNSYGSPTLSDQSLLSIPSLKLGPGDSSKSHTADEFIYLNQIHDAISTYIELLNNLKNY